jgi:hypothetical protein
MDGYSDPSPAIDYLMRSGESQQSPGGDEDPSGLGCLLVIVAVIALGFLFYLALH